MTSRAQADVLFTHGASPEEADELMAYNDNVFDLASLGPETRFPLPDEPFVAFWKERVRESRSRGPGGAFAVLREHLPQLAFPIRAGISETEPYRAATRRGTPVETIPEATGLELEHPEALEIAIHESPAGCIPLLIVRRRPEFAALLQALTKRNEPVPVPDSQGALMVSGYNNWSRVGELRRAWETRDPTGRETSTWSEEFRRIQGHPELYQDRFILLSTGPYSAVPAGDLGLDEDEWRELSLAVRRDHECTHYFTRRLFGSMRNNALDELIADWAGLTGATGSFRAAWFLRFMGIEDPAGFRPGARLEIYRGRPPLSDGAFRVLQRLLVAAAGNLERLDGRLSETARTPAGRAAAIAALASLRLEDLASENAESLVLRSLGELRERLPA